MKDLLTEKEKERGVCPPQRQTTDDNKHSMVVVRLALGLYTVVFHEAASVLCRMHDELH